MRIDIGCETDPGFFRKLHKQCDMTPKQYFALVDTMRRMKWAGLHATSRLQVKNCVCRSPWCPHCAQRSPAVSAISATILALRTDCIRHVVLTVQRKEEPGKVFARIRKKKAIRGTLRKLDLAERRWLWVLEFHRGGFPHWHLLIETDPGEKGRIGHGRIARAWSEGIVWEDYIRDEAHKRAMAGYARKTGYLAGEQKAHQIELPDYLHSQSRVRKYGRNFNPTPDNRNKVRGTGPKRKRNPARPYAQRLADCNQSCRIFLETGGIADVNLPGAVVREYLSERLEATDHSTFVGGREETRLAIEGLYKTGPAKEGHHESDCAQSGAQSGTQPGTQPGAQPGTQSGTQSGAQSGAQSGTQPGTQSGAQPGAQSGTQSGGDARNA